MLAIMLLLGTSTLTVLGRGVGVDQNRPSRCPRREGARILPPGVWSRPKPSGEFQLIVWEKMWENR